MIIFLAFTSIFIFIGVAALTILAEWQMIKLQKKWKWVIPAAITILAIFSSIQFSWISHSSSGIRSVSVMIEDVQFGEIQTAADHEKHMHAIGYLVNGETEKDLEYIALEYKEGELVGSEEAMQYKKQIDNAMRSFTKGFTGSTVSLEELRDEQDKISETVKTFSLKNYFIAFAFHAICPLVLWLMVLGDRLQRKNRNQLDKTRLEDL